MATILLNQTNRLRVGDKDLETIKQLCHLSKNLFNVGLYNVRQYFFTEGKFLRYESAYHHAKSNENYELLATDIGQQTLKVVDRSFRSFFNLIKLKRTGELNAQVNLPRYLPKDGYFMLVIPVRGRDWSRLPNKDWMYGIPVSRKFKREHGAVEVKIPERVRDKVVKEIRIIPRQKGRFFDISYIYESETETPKLYKNRAAAIDLGLDNLATIVSTTGESFMINGKPIKAKNQWFNKRNAKLQSAKDKQGIKGTTNNQARLFYHRNNEIRDYLNKSARYIVDFLLENKIGNLVVGYNPALKQKSNMGKRNNQNFVQMPIFSLRVKLQSLCTRYGINYIEQEESYTSKSSFLDRDILPDYNADNPQKYSFKGKRIKRGLYKTENGLLINADANGAANILKKAKSKQNLQINLKGLSSTCLAQVGRIQIV